MPVDSRYGNTSNGSQPTITRTVTKSVVPVSSTELVDPDHLVTKKHEEWTTSKRTVNHKTKQVETRVQRQLVLEDGRVVADSGPQVTTRTKEDNRVEESENTEHKTTGDESPGPGYTLVPGSAKVVSEKTESNQTMTETKEENRQLHDEHMRDLSGEEIHQRTLICPDEPSFTSAFGELPGKLTHFSSRSQKVVDKDETKEVSELKDGEVTTETTRTHHHEEAFDDEVPEEEAEEGMVPERSAEKSRTIQYYTDPRDFEDATERLREESRRSYAQHHSRFQTPAAVPAVAHRWVDRHFGPKEIGDTTRTSSGGNRITIEMSGHRSSPSDLSPRDIKLDRSRDSTLRGGTRPLSSGWRSPSPPYITTTPLHSSNSHTPLGRSTTSPFEVYSSSGSSRSKTPVKTFYLGEDNTYQKDSSSSWKKKSNHSLADVMSSGLSAGDTNSLGRSNLSGHYGERSDSFCRVPRSKITEPIRYNAFNNTSATSNRTTRVKTDKTVQASMSDDEVDEPDSILKKRSFGTTSTRERSLSPQYTRFGDRSTFTLPRTTKVSYEPIKSPLSTNSLTRSKYYKSSDSLHSPALSNYYSSNEYNSYRNASSPIYNNSSFHKGKSNDWNRNCNNGSYERTHEIKVDKRQNHLSKSVANNYDSSNGKNWYNSNSLLKSRIPTSPPESGYQSPFPPTPPSSPPPRLTRNFHPDIYNSSSSVSPPDSPLHHPLSTASIKKRSTFPSGGGGGGSNSRSRSSGDLRAPLFTPEAFSPLSSPLELKTVGKKDRKYYRVKPGQDGQSVVVQVRDWNGRPL